MKRSTAFVVILVLSVSAFIAGPALADEGQQTTPLEGFIAFTPYPTQEIATGETVTFNLVLRTGASPQVVKLNLNNLPDGWAATFKGGGHIIESAYVEPENDTKIDLKVDPPADVAPGTYDFTVMAHGETDSTTIPIELIVKDKLPPSLKLDADLPVLKGAPDTTFRYNTTLKNEGDEDLVVNLVADAPAGTQVAFKSGGQDVTSLPVAANESKKISVEMTPYTDLQAGDYQINVLAQGGDVEANTTLTAEVAGQSQISVAGPDGRLSEQAYVGKTNPVAIVIQNTGTAPAHNIQLTASPPAGWKVDFEPKQIPELAAGKQMEVTANVHPADQAIAGDYVVTVKAQADEAAQKSTEFRITVLTSTMWGIVGVGLIAVAVVVVGLAVARFGRR